MGSSDEERCERWDCSAEGVVNVKAEDGDCEDEESDGCACVWSAERMAACEGSRREVSISESVGSGERIEGCGGGMRFEALDKASHAAFSSSSLGAH